GTAEDGREHPAAVLDAIELAHGTRTIQGDAGLRALFAWLQQDRGNDTNFAGRRRVNVHLAERIDHLFQLAHRRNLRGRRHRVGRSWLYLILRSTGSNLGLPDDGVALVARTFL